MFFSHHFLVTTHPHSGAHVTLGPFPLLPALALAPLHTLETSLRSLVAPFSTALALCGTPEITHLLESWGLGTWERRIVRRNNGSGRVTIAQMLQLEMILSPTKASYARL